MCRVNCPRSAVALRVPRTCVTLSSVDGILTAQSHDRFQRHSRSPTLPSWVSGWRWIPSESEPVSRSGSATSMWNALQSKVSWPLSAQVYPLTTRRRCTCHNRKHRHRYSFRHTCIRPCSTFPFGPASPRSLILLTLGLSPPNLIADFSGQLAHLVFLSQR